MLINNYIKSRKYLLLLLLFIVVLIVMTTENKHIKKSENIFKSYLKNAIKKKNLKLIDVQDIKFSYLLKYKRVFFIADLRGIKEVFVADIRVTKTGEIIDIKGIKQITNTPLTDEVLLFSNNSLFIYKSQFKTKETISIIKENTLSHLNFKNENENIIKYEDNSFFINGKETSIDDLKSNNLYSVYKESLNSNKLEYNDALKNIVVEKKWENNFKYTRFLGVSSDKNIPFKYAKIQIPEKHFFEIYFFDKKNYFVKAVDSGGVKHSKTGIFFKESKFDKKNIYMDFDIKGGYSFDEKLLRPTILNYPSVVIDRKNHLSYGFLKKEISKGDLLLQFAYPLVYKANKKVQIENFKNNLKASSKLVKKRTGICIKDNLVGYFHLLGNRNLLTDYLYLIDCDYAFETNTSNIGSVNIKNSKPKIILKPKEKSSSKIKFGAYQFLKKYTDEKLTIYSIPCGDLNLSYKIGKSDPLTSKIINTEVQSSGITLLSGSIDPINPDGLVINKDVFYELKNNNAFSISKKSCDITAKFDIDNNFFYREGELILKNGKKLEISDKKYRNIVLAVGIKDDMVLLYQFKKASSYTELYKYSEKTNVKTIIVFENSGEILNKESGKLFINSLKKGSEIYELD